MSRPYSIAEARDNLAQIVHKAERGSAVELTRRGRPVAVIVSCGEYERLQAPKTNFWTALQKFRREYKIAQLNIDDSVFANLRDQAPGRDFKW